MVIFSVCLGAGATGLLLKPAHLPNLWSVMAAVLGGLMFYLLIVRPLSGVIFQFASKPSLALEGALSQSAEALTPFDASGKGIVRLNIDGQLVRVLATLEADDRLKSASIQPGEQLTVIAVDGRTNTCRVARL
jgi:hypothetical protein